VICSPSRHSRPVKKSSERPPFLQAYNIAKFRLIEAGGTVRLNIAMVSEKSGQLRRVLGVGFGLAVSIGGTIGVGILRTPGLVAEQLHAPVSILLLWVAGGIYTLLGASCLTELGLMLPRAGGFYVYVRRAFGNTAGFAVGWTDWLMYCSILGYLSIAIAEFIAALGLIPGGAIRFLSVLILLSIVALQWLGIRISSLFQEVTTSLKCVAFLVLVAACLLVPTDGYPSARIPSSMTFSGSVIALQAIVITYGGWQSPLYFIEEDRDPARNLPRTMIGGVLSVIGIYLLVNIALLKVVPISELSGSTLPAADAARVIAGAHGRNLIILLSVVSLVPLLNAVTMMGTRVIFGMGRDQLFWSRTSTVNRSGTPDTATLLTAAVALGLIATGTFQRLIAMTSFFLAANYSLCCVALVVLRRREPDLPRPYQAWGYPWSIWLVVGGSMIFLLGMLAGDIFNGLAALGLLAIGLIGRALFARRVLRRDLRQRSSTCPEDSLR
jgi:basic amino acid/polyamine antiporter, APA family